MVGPKHPPGPPMTLGHARAGCRSGARRAEGTQHERRWPMKVCPRCNGRGWIDDGEDCPDCNGTGQVKDDEQEPAPIRDTDPDE
jgi:DnaJ-class molecular chaperone